MVPETGSSHGVTGKKASQGKASSLQCGIKSLRGCGTMRMFTLNLALLFVMQIAFATYVIGSSRTLEKRFSLSSKQVGAIHAIIDVIEVVSILFIGYFARHAHKPRFISITVLFNVIGAILYAMPYFLFGSMEDMQSERADSRGSHMSNSHNMADNGTDVSERFMCTGNRTEYCTEKEMSLTETNEIAFSLITVACICLGIGGSCVHVLGLTYIDENVLSQDTPLYFGLANSVMPLGPVIGFALAALCTRLPENLITSQHSPTDPEYIGAWWLGFLIIGTLVLMTAIPMFLFPKHFSHYYTVKDRRLKEAALSRIGHGDRGISTAVFGDEIKGFLRSLWKLVTNPTLVTLIISSVCGIIVMIMTVANATRYMEVQFGVAAFKANIVSAVSLSVACVIGNIAIGVIMKRRRIGVSGSALISALTEVAGVAVLAILMGVGCDDSAISTTMDKLDNRIDMRCNSHCFCPVDAMPVCGPDGVDFPTPCHAGCDAIINSTHYGNCSCFPGQLVSKGFCKQDCKNFPVYIVFVVIGCFFLSFGKVPHMVVNMRIVDPDLKSLSLSIIAFTGNLFGFIPAPVLFGALSDSACLLWQRTCDTIGACIFYNTANYRHFIIGTGMGFEVIAAVFSFMTWILIKRDIRLGRYNDHEDEADDEKHLQDSNTATFQQGVTPNTPDQCTFNQDFFLEGIDNKSFHTSMDDVAVSTLIGDMRLKMEESNQNLSHLVDRHLDWNSSGAREPGEKFGIIQSAMTYAVDMLAVTHKYVIDIMQLSSDYNTTSFSAHTGKEPSNDDESKRSAANVSSESVWNGNKSNQTEVSENTEERTSSASKAGVSRNNSDTRSSASKAGVSRNNSNTDLGGVEEQVDLAEVDWLNMTQIELD